MLDQSRDVGSAKIVPYVYSDQADERRLPAEFGRLTVPEVHGDTNGATLQLPFVRIPSTSTRPGPPIVFVAGGPGESGIAAGRRTEYSFIMRLRELADVVVFDQRGTGLSEPQLNNPYRWALPLTEPGDRDAVLRVASERSRQCAEFWRDRGIHLEAYNTEESAKDIGLLRESLGADRISLIGKSYGSHLAMATLRHLPGKIDRALIATVEGADHTIKLPSNVQRQLHLLDERISDQPELRKRIPSLLDLMRGVLDSLESGPVMVKVRDPREEDVDVALGKFDLQWKTAQGLGNPDFLRKLPARYLEMKKGDFSWLGQQILRQRTSWFPNAMNWCMDSASGISVERAEQIRLEAPNTLLGEVIDLPHPYVRQAWGAIDLGPTFRAPFSSDSPVLFVSGTLDGRTPYSNVVEIEDGFPKSQHFIVDGASHPWGDFLREPMVTEFYRFLGGEPLTTLRASIPFEFTWPPTS